MLLFSKFKETLLSVAPILLIVVALSFSSVPLGVREVLRFVFSCALVVVGLTFFLVGVDSGISPMGEQIGSALTKKRSLPLLLGIAAVIGFIVTISEPDIQVFAATIKSRFLTVDKTRLILFIAVGVSLFIMLGLLRTILHLSLKIVLLILYAILFTIVFLGRRDFLGVAFDSGGATTGPLTVPFILSLGAGVSSVAKSKSSDSSDTFGLTGIASIGPIMAVLLYSAFFGVGGSSAPTFDGEKLTPFSFVLLELKNGAASIGPLFIMLIVFQLTLLHLHRVSFLRILVGLLWGYIGNVIFLLGVNSSFLETGAIIGTFLGSLARTPLGAFLLIALSGILGAVVVLAEPAVAVLTEQVENITGGVLKKRLILISLSFGGAAAVIAATLSSSFGVPLFFILVVGYVVALLLMPFAPPLFTAVAFDSGGVASGPVTSTFILSFALGAGSASSSGGDGFGVIALVALAPLIAIQILGIIYNQKKKRQEAPGGYDD